MKNILLICSDYLSNTDASGICTRNIAQEMMLRGYDVSVISEADDSDITLSVVNGINVYKVKKTFFAHILNFGRNKGGLIKIIIKLISIIRYFFVFLLYPNISPLRANKVKNLMFDIIEEKSIDTVIGMYRPYESIKSVVTAKRRYDKRIKAVTYHLDLIQSPSNKNGLIKKYKRFVGKKAINKELNTVDLMLLPESAEEIYKKHKKTCIVDFPLYIKREPIFYEKTPFFNDTINISFIGTLDKNNRSPEYIIRLIELLNQRNKKNIKLYIWGKLSDKETADIILQNKSIQYLGIVENKYVPYILKNSDFVLNIGNKITFDMIPSKIFQLFASCRPVINIVREPNDSSLKYFEKYKYAINLKEYERDLQQEALALEDFLLKSKDNNIKISDDLFIKSTPQYMVDSIESNLNS